MRRLVCFLFRGYTFCLLKKTVIPPTLLAIFLFLQITKCRVFRGRKSQGEVYEPFDNETRHLHNQDKFVLAVFYKEL